VPLSTACTLKDDEFNPLQSYARNPPPPGCSLERMPVSHFVQVGIERIEVGEGIDLLSKNIPSSSLGTK
jgi:hypothetical protein